MTKNIEVAQADNLNDVAVFWAEVQKKASLKVFKQLRDVSALFNIVDVLVDDKC